MAIEVFNRYEKKYMLDEKTYQEVLSRIHRYMDLDAYNVNGEAYTISNVYFDSSDDYLIRHSLEKPMYKEKLRLRSYGCPELEDRVFLEIKKKYKGVVNKRRTEIKLEDAYRYLETGVLPSADTEGINWQVLREIDYMKHLYQLEPKLYLSYERVAFFEKSDGDFRMTFDKNIVTRRVDLRLENGSYGSRLLPKNTYLMEIKISSAVPIWFTRILSELQIYPVSFSKYGTEYKMHLLDKLAYQAKNVPTKSITEKGESVCLNPSYRVRQAAPSA